MTLKRLMSLAVIVAFPAIAIVAAYGQQGRWAAAGDATAKFMVDAERQWAEEACSRNGITKTIVADDFQGTSPQGKRYTKPDLLSHASETARDCRLIDANVRFFGDNLAIVYGSETAVEKGKDGTEKARCLIWTDTWLKRDGKWQIIAAQDMPLDCK